MKEKLLNKEQLEDYFFNNNSLNSPYRYLAKTYKAVKLLLDAFLIYPNAEILEDLNYLAHRYKTAFEHNISSKHRFLPYEIDPENYARKLEKEIELKKIENIFNFLKI